MLPIDCCYCYSTTTTAACILPYRLCDYEIPLDVFPNFVDFMKYFEFEFEFVHIEMLLTYARSSDYISFVLLVFVCFH